MIHTYVIIVHTRCMRLSCGWFVPYVAKILAKPFVAYRVNQPFVVVGICITIPFMQRQIYVKVIATLLHD